MAKESLYFIVPIFIFSLFFFLIGIPCVACVVILLAFPVLYFFRDPERIPPEDENVLVSPADGKVMSIEELNHPTKGGPYKRISIFMSPLDVHVNRSPLDGQIVSIERKGGGYLPAYKPESVENEKVIIEISSENRKFVVEMIAGIMARRIKPFVSPGEKVKRGQRIGIIMLGSRVDFYFPPCYEVLVKEEEKVKAGLTAIVRIKDEE